MSTISDITVTHRFEPGLRYHQRSIGDHTLFTTLDVVSRTPRTIIAIVDNEGEARRFRVDAYHGVEYVAPFGRYSMATIVGADRLDPIQPGQAGTTVSIHNSSK